MSVRFNDNEVRSARPRLAQDGLVGGGACVHRRFDDQFLAPQPFGHPFKVGAALRSGGAHEFREFDSRKSHRGGVGMELNSSMPAPVL